jgi:hypothetical protein
MLSTHRICQSNLARQSQISPLLENSDSPKNSFGVDLKTMGPTVVVFATGITITAVAEPCCSFGVDLCMNFLQVEEDVLDGQKGTDPSLFEGSRV